MQKRKHPIIYGICFLLLTAFPVIGCSQENDFRKQDPAYSEISNNQEAGTMSTEKIIELIKQKDETAVNQGQQLSPETLQAIAQLMEDEDAEVRKIVLDVLNNNPGQATRQAMLTGLGDKNVNVRSLACRMLLTHYDESDLRALSTELPANGDEFVREHIALALGKMGNTAAITPLKRQLARELDPDARHAMHLALIRLKEPENQKQYTERLSQTDPKEKARAVLDFEYIGDLGFLPAMMDLLDDTRPALNVGKSNKKIYIRVCDVVINTLDRVLNHPFAFDVFPRKEYAPEEISQARETLQKLIGRG